MSKHATKPAADSPVRETHATQACGVGDAAAGHRILVVDDNVDAAVMLATLLETKGYEVCIAHDGEEGLRAAEVFAPTFVLLDIGLPRMDGYEAARRLRDRYGARLSIVALTGYGTADARRKAIEAGFCDHLVKPVRVEVILSLLARSPVDGRLPAPTRASRTIRAIVP